MKIRELRMRSRTAGLRTYSTLFLVGLLAAPGGAWAVLHTISYSNGVDPAIVVCDDQFGVDLDPDPGELEVHFDLEDPVNDDWVASGVIYATTTNPAGATLIVTDTTIRNITGNYVLGAQIIVDHDFPPLVSLTQQYTAHIDGSFDKIGGGLLGNLTLDYSASVTGNPALGFQGFAASLELAPKFFDWTGLPFHEDTIIHQREHFIFYIDELDNTINFFNSASILPTPTVSVEESEWSLVKTLYR